MSTAISNLVNFGGRDTLIQDFKAVAEATTPDGQPRYAETPTMQWLSRFVTGATGGPNKDAPLYELCHLVTALGLLSKSSSEQRSLFFLGLTPISPSSLKSFFHSQPAPENLRIEDHQITIDCDQTHFSIRYGRMPRLIALYEFLAGMEGFAFFSEFNEIFNSLESEPPSSASIKTAANKLSSQMRRYRIAHLVSAESDGKFTTVYNFLQERSPENSITIDDAAIFEFWSLHNQRNDYKGYRTVFDLFFKFIQALDEVTSRRSAAEAGRLGSNQDHGELDLANTAVKELPGLWESPMDMFDTPPLDNIKFFKKSTERKPLEALMTYGPKVMSLPLAFMRYEVFGQIQSGITNDLQIGRGQDSIQNRIACTDAEPYPQRKELYKGLQDHVRLLIQASLHILSHIDKQTEDRTLIAFPGTVTTDPSPSSEAVLDDGAKAFKKLTRKGFEDHVLNDADKAEPFKLAADPLLSVGSQLEGLLKALDGLDLESLFDVDRNNFHQQFTALYGETS
ncbi:MAG: hypothetical protein OQK24_02865 [Magnetovibrio sp.]|nr:hypothetical protein [Magnetovibrio sp.]